MKYTLWLTGLGLLFLLTSCDSCETDTSDKRQQEEQERMLQEATSKVGMPAIKNFRERQILKDILELRDKEKLITYTYLFSEQTGDYKFFCQSIGYAIPYATQFTNPQKVEKFVSKGGNVDFIAYAQADPNGLFSPAAAEGSWVLCKDPNGTDVRPVYIEPRVITSPFRLEVVNP